MRKPGLVLSVAIMHHPRRANRIPALVESCRPYRPVVVTDPDPTGPPSPLRTAKRAWAAVPPDATHHLVLQDDVRLAPGFAGHVTRALLRCPRDAITLYSNWNSPQNAYRVRLAAATGTSWAWLSAAEWTPTQGLVLPADHAHALAAYLEPIPDEVRDDDEMIALFCAERNLPVVAVLPHLLDHEEEETIVGHHGSFHATVYAGDVDIPPHWPSRGPIALGAHVNPTVAVEIIGGRCLLRFTREGTGEPVEHGFGWYWADWAELHGWAPEEVLEAFPGGSPLEREVWAAGYLLGVDAAARGASPARTRHERQLLEHAVRSWVESGSGCHRGHADVQRLVRVGVAGVTRAIDAATRPPALAGT